MLFTEGFITLISLKPLNQGQIGFQKKVINSLTKRLDKILKHCFVTFVN
nr:MAG TPA: hypothetical protein [Caudoviricetes sp.]